ncbi:hypothetical protein HBH98_183920 [Parastagonospora nodorum]|nr:hypothetical protein HBH50_140230 [Parastagonospora nodorum]KAH4077744.1 hypothetical protein HBH48_239100 [Parastagonospora nodorum]KAH4340854.1 hypothetical protein HBH98_183920 [Parastagonospora nodorum]KAH4393719.1 hypothetical protein HBH97_032500 [Parastagonospora nodorum]KAH4423662.1 hypothetical protein HBH99_044220 [Parastagonospora nodorum]
MRLTRAAQRAQQPVEEPTLDAADASEERSPLNEITPNASPEQVDHAEDAPKKTLTRTKSKKGGKKGARAKKGKAVEEEEQVPVADEPLAVDDAAVEAAVEEPIAESPQDAAPTAVEDERPASPAPKAVRLTRRQLAKQEEEMRQSQRAQSPPRPEPATEDVAQSPIEDAHEEIAQKETKEETTTRNDEEIAVETQPEETIEPAELPQDEIAAPEPELHQHTDTVEPGPVTEDTSAGAEAIEVAETNETQAPELAEAQETQLLAQDPKEAEHIEQESATPSVEVTSEPEPKSLATERPTEVTSTPALSRTPSRRTSRSASKSPMRIEESIEALDALEEALENVGKAVSHFDSSTEEKSPRKKAFPRDATAPSARAKTPRKTPVAARVSRAPSAAPKSMKPAATGIARASSVRVAPVKDIRKDSTETFDYLASKRRPVSVSFPTPPPPPKGRAPTKPTFQLSSETVAAKLKAQKEERLKREAEREAEGAPVKQRPISMPPVAKSTKAPTKANFQLPGEAIAAKLRAQKEEREKREAESAQGPQPKARPVSICMPPPTVKSTKPLTKATFQLSGDAVAAKLRTQREERQKREEEAEAAKKAAASKPRPTIRKPVALPTRAAPGVTIPPPPPKSDSLQPQPPQRSTSLASKRSSIQLSRSVSDSTNGSNRNSLLIAKATVTPVDAVQQKLKGREVFNRDKMEKEAKERERREKEEAAKQARAQAAERGRIASREWAEKQRRKMMDAVRSKAEAA